MHLYLCVRTLTFFHIPGPPLAWSEGKGAIVDFAQANLLTARLLQAVQSKESSNGADEVHEGNESDEGYEDDEGNEDDEEHEESC